MEQKSPKPLSKWFIMVCIIGHSMLGLPSICHAVFVRPHVTISCPYVTLDHLFDDLPPKIAQKAPQIKIMPAPRPGKELFMRTRQILNIAKQHRIPWAPIGPFQGITIKAAGTKISPEHIGQKILALIPEQNSPSVILEKIPDIYLSSPEDFTLTNFLYNPKTHIFNADITPLKEGRNVGEHHRIYGRVHAQMDVPVPNRLLQPDDVLTKEDFTWISVDQKSIHPPHITDINTLIGLMPRRILRPHTLLRKNDFKRPIAIKKGTLVPIIYGQENLRPALKAKALENGRIGDDISFESYDLKKILKAKVVGMNKAQIG